MTITHALSVAFSLLIASQSARADPAYCVRGPKPRSPGSYTVWNYGSRVRPAAGIIYSQVDNCIQLPAKQQVPNTWCEVSQDHDATYGCGPGTPTWCDLDSKTSFLVYVASYTPQPDGSHVLCWGVRNYQQSNWRYFNFYVEVVYLLRHRNRH
jgi:hypothetical protein